MPAGFVSMPKNSSSSCSARASGATSWCTSRMRAWRAMCCAIACRRCTRRIFRPGTTRRASWKKPTIAHSHVATCRRSAQSTPRFSMPSLASVWTCLTRPCRLRWLPPTARHPARLTRSGTSRMWQVSTLSCRGRTSNVCAIRLPTAKHASCSLALRRPVRRASCRN